MAPADCSTGATRSVYPVPVYPHPFRDYLRDAKISGGAGLFETGRYDRAGRGGNGGADSRARVFLDS